MSVYIIAEAGISHLGKVDLAKKLIEEAYQAGANAIKFQYYDPYEIFPLSLARARECFMLSLKKYEELYTWVKNNNYKIDFGLSIFNDDEVPVFDFVKIGSRAIYLAEAIIRKIDNDTPIFVSTGYAFPDEIPFSFFNKNIFFLACDSHYPSFLLVADKLQRLIKKYKKAGYSGHFIGYNDCLVAVQMGACIIEKHFCLSRNEITIDKEHSLEPAEFKEMVNEIKNIEKMLLKLKRNNVYYNA